ncbi:hypothetical protein [Streptomyces sp. GQFP]|uniref:hypothetical protein n=1 Tax=Streptomyces sp. GQFP TaxID=2907545 RepID=UPI001F40DADF|nr:hypothetical protein [Streptomyces sp. GQFP]UIX28919.1 hypothetical protein LUX31_02180 [Streptomyces sp. GQFP]
MIRASTPTGRASTRAPEFGGRGTPGGRLRPLGGGQGAEHAEVTACAGNTDAIRFYERNGFAPQSLTLRLSLGTGR